MVTKISGAPLLGTDHLIHLVGHRDESLRAVEKAFGVKVRIASEGFVAEGKPESAEGAIRFFDDLSACVGEGYRFQPAEVAMLARFVANGSNLTLRDLVSARVSLPSKKRHVIPKSRIQKDYLDAIRESDCVFGIGPAGTGKTYLAMAMAVSALLEKSVSRIVLTRPVVEAGERLGFLPGDLQEKVTRFCVPCSTPCTRWSNLIGQSNFFRGGRSRSLRWPT